MSAADITAIWLTLKLAFITTLILLVIGAPLAWWLRSNQSWPQKIVGALVSLPLVLPPTVLGFYLLLFMGPHGPLGYISQKMGLGLWAFTFRGLVLGSVIYSMPFVVQPIQNAFEALGEKPMAVAATLGASPLDSFFTVIIPQCKNAFLTAAILGFAHTLGEFGVVIMVGGNIPGITNVVSTQIFGYVEASEYAKAHYLAGGMLLFSFLILITLQIINPKGRGRLS